MGRPEIAFLWKNLLSTWPYFSRRVLAVAAGVIVVGSAWARAHPDFKAVSIAVGWIGLGAGVYIMIIGAQFARQDVRSDLTKLDVLKTYPLAGWQVVLGEMLTPAAILTGSVWLALLTFVLNAEAGSDVPWLTPWFRVAAGISLLLLVPPTVMLQLLVPNAAALVFPSWMEATRSRGGGPEVMGQRMIFFFAQLLTLVVLLVPAGLAGAAVVFLAQLLVGLPVALVLAAVPVALVLGVEVALGVWWLGGRFEKIDIAEELRT